MNATSARSVCELWPSLEALAGDTGASLFAVRKWHFRDRLPAEWWTAIVAAAEARGIAGVTLETLAAMHAKGAAEAPREAVEARA